MKSKYFTLLAVLAINFGVPLSEAEEEITFGGYTFKWVNPFPADLEKPPGLHHGSFQNPSMPREIGYAIYLPPQYSEDAGSRFPVVYYLHGGRPVSESRSVGLSKYLHEAMSTGVTAPAIYVYVNGGILSHYNYAPLESMGEDLFIKELIPFIDSNYRTIADRRGRAIQGFSQGGRGTTRNMFKYPELFSSAAAAAGGPGYSTEKQISESSGVEFDARGNIPVEYDFGKESDAYTLARKYAESDGPKLEIAFWIGTKGFNYEATIDYMKFLDGLEIDYKVYTVGGVGHNPDALYQEIGGELMDFHSDAFTIQK